VRRAPKRPTGGS